MILPPLTKSPTFHFLSDLEALAEDHCDPNLHQSDKHALTKAATTLANSMRCGSLLGLSAGLYLVYRLRRRGVGPNPPYPALARFLAETPLGGILLGGLFGYELGMKVGGDTGLFVGSLLARRELHKDQDSRGTILEALRQSRGRADSSFSVVMMEG